uniref:Uncharacterized protein n=1 Tax=Arundo donax TaxID=35708 RepID=A0A0A9GA66_ARUDO
MDVAAVGPRFTSVVQAVSQRHGAIDEAAHGIAEAHEPFDAAAVAVALAAVDHRVRRGRRRRVRGGAVRERRHHGGWQVRDEVLRVRRELERRQLVDLVLRSVEQPVHDLARLAEPQPVLEVVELDRRRHGEAHAPVAQPLDCPHLAVPVLAAEHPRDAHDPRLRGRRPVPRACHGALGGTAGGRLLGLGAPGQLLICVVAAYHRLEPLMITQA